MVCWPCILKLDGDDELIYLASENDLNLECSELILSDADYLIDSDGVSYFISTSLGLIKTMRILPLDEVIDLIRAHEFNKASLCLTKIHFTTISDAVHSLSY